MFGKTGYRDGGTRGGQDRFKWEDVKLDERFRENYLGHSLKAPVGRWQKNKDLQWFTKQGKKQMSAAEIRRAEIEEIRQRDEDMINEALGLAPKRATVVETQLEPGELKQLLAKGQSERDRLDVERVEGLGAAPAPRHDFLGERKSVVERELERMKKAKEEGTSFAYENRGIEDKPDDEGEEDDEGGEHDEQDQPTENGDGLSKKEKKKRKKEERKAKKEMKKAKKREKKDREGGREGGSTGDNAGAPAPKRRMSESDDNGIVGSKRRRHDSRSPSRDRDTERRTGRERSPPRARDGERGAGGDKDEGIRRRRVGSASPHRGAVDSGRKLHGADSRGGQLRDVGGRDGGRDAGSIRGGEVRRTGRSRSRERRRSRSRDGDRGRRRSRTR